MQGLEGSTTPCSTSRPSRRALAQTSSTSASARRLLRAAHPTSASTRPTSATASIFPITRSCATAVASYGRPPNAPQPSTSNRLDTLDGRLTQAVSGVDPAHGGAVGLWTQQTVAGGAGSQVRWYELNPASHSIFQSGAASDGALYV